MEPSPFPEADSCITEPGDGTLLISVHKDRQLVLS
jgi:hypothetical protein